MDLFSEPSSGAEERTGSLLLSKLFLSLESERLKCFDFCKSFPCRGKEAFNSCSAFSPVGRWFFGVLPPLLGSAQRPAAGAGPGGECRAGDVCAGRGPEHHSSLPSPRLPEAAAASLPGSQTFPGVIGDAGDAQEPCPSPRSGRFLRGSDVPGARWQARMSCPLPRRAAAA